MSENDFSDLGREIGAKIDKFVNSKEIKELQENIKTSVETAMNDVRRSAEEVRRSTKEASGQMNKYKDARWEEHWKASAQGHRNRHPYAEAGKQPGYYETNSNSYNNSNSNVNALAQKRQLPVVRKPNGKVAGVLMTVFGTIGSVAGWTASLVCLIIYFLAENALWLGTVSLGLSAVGAVFFTAMAIAGGFLRRRANRFKSYVKSMGIKDFYPIKGFAEAVNKKEKYVVKDLNKMIGRGWFKEGHLDAQETCFMLTDESYKLYVDAQNELKRRKEEEERLTKEQETLEQDPLRKQLMTAVEEGHEYVRRIRAVNDEIPGEEISEKLDRLENIGTKIFEYVEENPGKLQDIRKFMNYYLPTTLKLVEAYQEFCSQPVQGDNIRTARQEIEETLDDINNAFEKMFDKLFENDALDISTDISVLSTMLAQEGLLKDEFSMKK